MSLLITILTGGRPTLLARTLASLEQKSGSLLRDAEVVVFVNGEDLVSRDLVARCDWVDEILEGNERLKIGPAISKLMAHVDFSHHDHLFHLEDDWECLRGFWYQAAVAVLRDAKGVGQVRLRRWRPLSYVGAAVSRYHLVTKAPLRWRASSRGKYQTARAHYTFNPSLVPAAVAQKLFPCDSEVDAAAKFHRTKLLAAQVLPGCFRHIGAANSLRERVGGG